MRQYYALFIKNRIKYDLSDDIEKFTNYLNITQGIQLIHDTIETDLDVKHKDFGVKISGGDFGEVVKTAWGLDGIKEQLRQAKIAMDGQYHVIFFLYELGDWDFENKPLGAWTYPNPLNYSAFVEMPSTLLWEKIDSTFRLFTHENLHAEHRICWWKGIPTRDTMDGGEIEVDCETGKSI